LATIRASAAAAISTMPPPASLFRKARNADRGRLLFAKGMARP
jgi:hypothetical protein